MKMLPPSLLVVLPWAAIAACAPARPTSSSAPASEPIAQVVASVSAAPSASSAPSSFELKSAHVDATGCGFEGPTGDQFVISYAANEKGTNFALVMTDRPVALRLGELGKPSSVKFDVFGLTLDVQVPDNGLPLHARRPLAMGGVYDPDPRVRLHWQTAPRFAVETHAGSPPRFIIDAMTAVSCEDVGLKWTPNFGPEVKVV